MVQFQFSYHFYRGNQESFRALKQNRPFRFFHDTIKALKYLRKTEKSLALLAFLLAIQMIAPPAFAEKIKIRGAGATTCADWMKAKGDPTLTKFYDADVQWVMGFLVGFSHFKEKELLKSTDYDAVAAYVDQKCKLKPLALIFDAAVELGEDLAK